MARSISLFLGPVAGAGAPDRGSLQIGAYEPDSATTGVLPGTVLTPLSGNQIISTNNVTLLDRDISGIVEVRAANVTIQNCRIRGDATRTTNHGLILATHANCVNLQVVDCTIAPDTSTVWQTGILGHDYTALRNDIYFVIDGCGVYNTNNPGAATNVVIDQNYFHDFPWFSVDPNHADGSHNDCVQIQGGSGCTVRGNSMNGYFTLMAGRGDGGPKRYGPTQTQTTSCMMFNSNVGNTTANVVEDNWLRGGEIGFNMGGVTGNQGHAYRNQFDYGQWFQGSGGTDTHTMDLDALVTLDHGNSGPASSDPNRNTYVDMQNITVRTNA